jgi:hypothetical protein
MNTAVTIPWEAVVEGCPPSQAKALPLVVSEHYRRRSERDDEGKTFDRLIDRISQLGHDAMAMISRSSSVATLELALPGEGIFMLTSDETTKVVLQQASVLPTACLGGNRGFFATTYVARYARFDADGPGFFIRPDTDDDSEHHGPTFMNPHPWGFEPTAKGYRWTASDMFTFTPSGLSKTDSDYAVLPRFADPLGDPVPERGDPFQCIPALRQILAVCRWGIRPETPAVVARPACYNLALALGRCRQFGVRVPAQDDRTLSPAGFDIASTELMYLLRNAIKRLTDDRFARVLQGWLRMRNHALETLETRMNAHAAYLALDEAYAAALYDGSPEVPAMSRRLTQVRRLINLFDGNLRKNLPLLRLAASTYLLDNWRRLLAPAHRDCPPWWLDGCIG